MFKRIVVPLDGSRLSAQSLPHAVALARQFNSEVMLVRVLSRTNDSFLKPGGSGGRVVADIVGAQAHAREIENSAHAKRYLMNWARGLRDQGINVSCNVLEGMPVPSIMEFARENNASLIVMMSHGRGRSKPAELGSVTDAIVRGGTIPVLVVHAKTVNQPQPNATE
ncbi:MAG: universal stress protein [Dehalococcoidia bacterium]|nr:universal stress protein [Dehalococcoidia bacterium]